MPTIADPVPLDLMRGCIVAALTWFYDTEQPPIALQAGNGPDAITGGVEWLLRCRQFRGDPIWPVMSMSTLYFSDAPDPRLPAGAGKEFLRLLEELGHSPRKVRHWNPRPNCNVQSVQVELDRQMHPSLINAVENWDNYGCPEHRRHQSSPQCRDSGTCEWGARAKLTIYPTWPAGAVPTGICQS